MGRIERKRAGQRKREHQEHQESIKSIKRERESIKRASREREGEKKSSEPPLSYLLLALALGPDKTLLCSFHPPFCFLHAPEGLLLSGS